MGHPSSDYHSEVDPGFADNLGSVGLDVEVTATILSSISKPGERFGKQSDDGWGAVQKGNHSFPWLGCVQREAAAHVKKQTAPRGKKRSALLAGLDIDNIIQPEDSPPSSSAPASSYSFRTQARERSELCYDQKYHPIDDFTRPKRAAKMRLRYGKIMDSDSEPDIHTYVEASDSDESDTENYAARASRKVIKGRNNLASSHTATPPPSTQPPRRASQRVNREVAYNMSAHPQDDEIFETEGEEEAGDSESDADSESEGEVDVKDETGVEVQESDDEEHDNQMGGAVPSFAIHEERTQDGQRIFSTSTMHATSQTIVGDSIMAGTTEQNVEQSTGMAGVSSTEARPVATATDTDMADSGMSPTRAQQNDNEHRALTTIHENTAAEVLDGLRPTTARLPRFHPFPVLRPSGHKYVIHQPSFYIYEEPQDAQNAAMANNPPVSLLSNHDGNENDPPVNPPMDSLVGYRVHTAKDIAKEFAETGKEPDWDEYITNGDDDGVPSDDSIFGPSTPTSTSQGYAAEGGTAGHIVRALNTRY